MTPLIETLLLITFAIALVLASCWAFGAFKRIAPKKADEPEEPTTVIPEPQPVETVEEELPKTEEKTTELPGKKVAFSGTQYFFKAKGNWFPVMKSSQGSMFIITESGQRRYLKADEKAKMKTLSDIS